MKTKFQTKSHALYIMKVDNFDDVEFEKFLQLADEHIKHRLNNESLHSKRNITLMSNIFRKYCVYKHCGLSFNQQKICFNEFNKPFLKNQNIHFNISHCDNYIVCLIANKPVGIDIQKITKYKDSFANYIFDEKTINTIKNSNQPDLEFTKQWTKLESYLKQKGTGFVNYKKENIENIKHNFFFVENYVICASY